MQLINTLFGHGDNLNIVQMTMRGIVIFFITLLMLRIAGQRTLGKKSTFDNVVIIMLGAVLSRAVVGASPFFPVIVSSLGIVIVHRLVGFVCVKNDAIGRLVKGDKRSLFNDGEKNIANMKRTLISDKDFMEGIRLKINIDSLDEVKEVFIERSGEISVIKSEP